MRLTFRQTHLYRFVNMECVDKKDAGALREFLRLLFSLILKYYNSCDLSTKIDKILNLFAG